MLWLDSLRTKFKESRRLEVESQYQKQMREEYGRAKKRSSENDEDNCDNSCKRMKRVLLAIFKLI